MKNISCLVRTVEHISDKDAREVLIAVEPEPGETVEGFANRVIPALNLADDDTDVLEIRLVRPPKI